ncbi:hypothetical protein [Aliiroseovarius crassostreae]|uniref:hypothetical protein n=1 Tax=Aliiroseovarius crassostreae TaxID=154981 RepID=UPI003C79E40D
MPSAKSKPKSTSPKSAHPPIRVCLIGDSHLAAFKKAVDEGYDAGPDVKISFYGASGPEFRKIGYGGGVIRPDRKLAESGGLIATDGKDEITAEDYDAVLFTGARLRSVTYFEAMLPGVLDPTRFVSSALRDVMTERFVTSCRAARMAMMLRRRGTPVVGFTPASFLNAGVDRSYRMVDNDLMRQATAETRAEIWAGLRRRLDAAGIGLFEQPEETVTEGGFSHPDYVVEGAADDADFSHKNPAYARLILDAFFGSDAFAALREERAA